MAKTLTPAAVDEAPDVALTDVVEAPEPLRRAWPPPESYPLDALGTILAPMARKLREVVQAPDAICGQSVLGAGTLAVQGHADVINDGRTHPIADYLLTVGESGERKSAVDRCALWPHRHWERSLHERYRGEELAYQNEAEAYRKARDEALKQAKGRTAKQADLDALWPAPIPPLEAMLIVEEPTYEGLIKALRIGQPSMGLYSAEGGRLIGGHGMNQDNQLKTAAGLSELWDGVRISRVRATDETTILYGRRLSMHVMVQPVVAHSVLSNAILLGQGILSRCLIAWPTSTAGTRLYRAINLTQDPDVKRYNARLLTILKTPFPLAADTQNKLTPRALALRGYPETFSHCCRRSRSILAVMKRRAIVGTEPVEHKMYVTDLDHSSTGLYTALIVLAVPAAPPVPGIGPLNHPALLQWREAFRARWTRLDFNAPAAPMCGHPDIQSVIAILLIRKNCDETRKVVWRDVAEQGRCRDAIIETGTGNKDGQ